MGNRTGRAVLIVMGLTNGLVLSAQATAKFEVASIRRITITPGEPIPASCLSPASPGRLTMCTNVANFLRNAYTVYANGRRDPSSVPAMVEGGPGWMNSDTYAINATADNASAEMMQGPMMQALLEDRFKLKFHREIRQVPVYELTIGKNDSKLLPHETGNCTPPEPGAGRPAFVPGPGEKPVCKGISMSRNGQTVTVTGEFVPFQALATGLYGIGAVDRPVINKTGLAQIFDLHLEFSSAYLAADDSSVPSVFTVIEEQLGLKLQSAKGPREFLVVDNLERPTEN